MKTNALNFGLLFLRLGISIGMLTHGYGKFMKILAGDFSFGDPIGIGPTASLILCTIAEFIAPLFLIAGFFQPTKVAIAGAIVWIFRLVGGIGYLYGQRMYGAPWHLGEIYLLYIIGYSAYNLLFGKNISNNISKNIGIVD